MLTRCPSKMIFCLPFEDLPCSQAWTSKSHFSSRRFHLKTGGRLHWSRLIEVWNSWLWLRKDYPLHPHIFKHVWNDYSAITFGFSYSCISTMWLFFLGQSRTIWSTWRWDIEFLVNHLLWWWKRKPRTKAKYSGKWGKIGWKQITWQARLWQTIQRQGLYLTCKVSSWSKWWNLINVDKAMKRPERRGEGCGVRIRLRKD
jgi:hypothetical protein